MAVIVVHKNEAIDSVLRRFQRQVVKEGIVAEVLRKRYYISDTEERRLKKHELKRSASRKRNRAKSKPRTMVSAKRKLF